MNPVVEKAAFGVLIASLSIEGLFLLFTGWWLPEVSTSLRFLGLCWLLVCVTTCFIRKRPYVQIASVWLWLLISIWHWWSITEERSLVWFLYQHVFPIMALVSSHLMVLFSNTTSKGAYNHPQQ